MLVLEGLHVPRGDLKCGRETKSPVQDFNGEREVGITF